MHFVLNVRFKKVSYVMIEKGQHLREGELWILISKDDLGVAFNISE